jgi:hypothetical protein
MYKFIMNFMSDHLVLGALLASVLWFYGGHQYLASGKRSGALGWQTIAVLILVAFCVNAILNRAWLSLAVALGAMLAEIWIIGKWWRQKN